MRDFYAYNKDMQPEIPQPMFSGGPEAPKKSHKKAIIISIVAAVLVILGVLTYLLMVNSKPSEPAKTAHTFKPIQFGTESETVSYAGSKVYDACNMLSQSVFEKHVDQYAETTKTLGSDKTLESPVMMDHGYIDRTIPTVLGRDGVAREPSVTVGETSVDSTLRARSFMNIADSYCMYGQGASFNLKLAEVYVIQQPTPLSDKLVGYLSDLKQKGRMVAESQGVQVYVETVEEGDSQHIVILKKGTTVVFVGSSKSEVVQAASDEVVSVLAKEPTGPMTATYPEPYQGLKNPCQLFSASEFEQLLGKPASSITLETLALTEVEENIAQRKCTRHEVERLRQGEITTSIVTLAEARTEDQAKKRIAAIKGAEGATSSSVADLGDEAYLVATERENRIVVRSGKQVVEVTTSGEAKDASPEAFSGRTLPVAKQVLTNLKK